MKEASSFNTLVELKKYYKVKWIKFKKRTKSRIRNTKNKIIKYKSLELAKELIQMLGYFFVYGLLLNYPITVLFGKDLTPFTIMAYGVLYYLIRRELPRFVYDLKVNPKR